MNLTPSKNPTNYIAEISDDLNRYGDLTRSELFTQCINKHLNATLSNYELQLNHDVNFLSKQDEQRVLKAIMKNEKIKNKEIISKYMEEK